MSVWEDIVGQSAAVEVLDRAAHAAAAGRGGGPVPGMTHAWLVTGPPGSGRSNAARAFAAALQCPDAGCGHCHECRTALRGTHADVELFATEHAQIRKEQVVPLLTIAQRRPSGGHWRVLVIEDADRLNDFAANTLLKSIEEPPPRTVWVLCAPSPQDVLTTIRSRCRHVGLRVPPAQAVAELLVRRDGIDPAMAAFAARAAQSHVGLALRLARDEGARIRRREVLRLALEIGSVGEAVLAAGNLAEVAGEESTSSTADRDATERAVLLRSLGAEGVSTLPPAVRAQVRELEADQKRRATRARTDVLDRAMVDLLSLYRDVLVVQLGADVELVNAEMRGDVERLARAGTAEQTVRRMDAVGLARERIAANSAPLLTMEAMALSLMGG